VTRQSKAKDRMSAHGSSLAKQLRVRVRQQEVVADLGVYALAGADLQPLMDEAVRQVARTLDMDYCKVLELLPSGDALLLKAGVGWQEGLIGKGTVGTDRDSQAGYTLRSKEPVIVDDLRSETRFRGPSLLVEHGVVSGMSVIIHGADGPYGVLGTHTRQLRSFSRDDVHFIQAVANILGEAVARKRTEARVREAHDQLEKRVRERTAELQAANEELEAFSYSVSHDLRAPLRGMDGFSQALLEDYGDRLDETGKRYLERLIAGAARMTTLIDDLLELAQLGRGQIESTVVDLSRLAWAIVGELRESDPERVVEVDIEEDLKADGDAGMLRAALENLLGNAWKFTRNEERPLIEVGAQRSPDGETVYFVRDNGAGFDMNYVARLFVPFQRLHGQEVFEGQGIGLATVKRIISKHGGRVWGESQPGKGAAFRFTLPERS
jgi:signal transduction histidine kinase